MNQKILDEKQKLIDEIVQYIKDDQSIFVVEYRGLSVIKLAQLRKELAKVNQEMRVFKNTFVERAVEQFGHHDLKDELKGPNAFIFPKKDVINGAKVLTKFAKKNDKLVIKGALVEGKLASSKDIATLATLSSREDLIASLLGVLQAPIANLAVTLKSVAEKQN